jgi:hypothetical protein
VKKILSSIIVCLVIFQLSLLPKNSEAALGVGLTASSAGTYAFGGIALMVGGGGLTALGITMLTSCKENTHPILCLFYYLGGAYIGVLGIVLLDEESHNIYYKNLNQLEAINLNISESERLSYNRELEEVNLFIEEISLDFKNVIIDEENLTKINKSIKRKWSNVFKSGYLSQETVIAVKKIQAYLVNNSYN